jgi:RNA polymerase-interacting CarD/CdnL/TRCF family regulator
MSHIKHSLRPGDRIFHPRFGFGAVHGVARRERTNPMQGAPSVETEAARTEEYYDIHLDEGGTLLVPVRRAESVGLRRLSFGVEAIKENLHSPAQELPDNFRERAEVLRARGQRTEPMAFVNSVRDMLAQSRGRTLSASEKTWLNKSCQRLSAEAALVDNISIFDAERAIQAVVRELSAV